MPQPRVLVVDDDEVIRGLITVNLELEGFAVATAADGVECLERLAVDPPDVVTLDVMMPRLDGLSALARLRAAPATAAIKVLVVSARAQEADIAAGYRLGADLYLTKPFDPAELVAAVRKLAGEARRPEDPDQDR